MNINYKEPQFELFPANSASLEDINKPKFLLASLTLTTESLVILVILAIMIALFSFSIGVERGKHLAAQSLDEKVSAAWGVSKRPVAVAPAVATIPSVNTNQSVTIKSLNKTPVVHPMLNSTVVKTPLAKPTNTKLLAVPAAPVANSVSAGKWTVQLATYKSENYAQQEALGYKSKGVPVFIIKFKEYYLVCAGQFASQVQADAFAKKIPGKKQGSQVRRI